MATHFGILAWEIPWTEELAGYSPWGHKRLGHRKEIKQPTRLTPVERQSIVFPQGQDPNMLQAIQTDLGIGLPVKGEIDTDTRQCKIDLELLRDE